MSERGGERDSEREGENMQAAGSVISSGTLAKAYDGYSLRIVRYTDIHRYMYIYIRHIGRYRKHIVSVFGRPSIAQLSSIQFANSYAHAGFDCGLEKKNTTTYWT